MKLTNSLAGALCLSVSLTFGGTSLAKDGLVVYIECTSADQKRSQGSGVLVSELGHVLTARHVVPDGSICQASVGNNTRQTRGIRPSFEARKIDEDFDALLMEFGRDANETFPFASVCAVTDALKGKEIVAKGFDKDSFGSPDVNDGVLSNTTIDFDGMVQMTAETINGKSGGPVFLKGSDTIVGIIAGAEFNAQGIVSSYKMLAVDALLDDVKILDQADMCGTKDLRPAAEQQPLSTADTGPRVDRQSTQAAPIYQTIATRDAESIIEMVVSENALSRNQIEVCLENLGNGAEANRRMGQAKRMRISGVDILAPWNTAFTCKQIDPSGGFGQFSKQKGDNAFYLVGSYVIEPVIYAGKRLTFRWSEK